MTKGILLACAVATALLLSLFPATRSYSQAPVPPLTGQLRSPVDPGPGTTAGKPLYVPGQLVVRFGEGVERGETIRAAAHLGVRELKRLLLPRYSIVSVPAELDLEMVSDTLRRLPGVESVEHNGYRYAFEVTPNDPLYEYQWHFPAIQLPQAWEVSTGSGVVVAVVDTGVAYEDYGAFKRAPDLAAATFVPGWDFTKDNVIGDGDGDVNDAHANDDYGHGTHVAGTIAQSTNNGIGVAGAAYGAKIMPVKVLDKEGNGSNADVADGIVWAVDHGAKVINLSLGGPTSTQVLLDAVNYAYGKGAVVVAAAGNDGTELWYSGGIGYPAAYPSVIAVGATQYSSQRAPYSNYGSGIDLVAPGGNNYADQNGDLFADGILQQTFCNPRWDKSGCTSTDYDAFHFYFMQGTSMAAPHVSAVAALLLSHGIATSPEQVHWVLRLTAKDLGAAGWDQDYGFGLVQAFDALNYPLPPGWTPSKVYLPLIVRQ